MNGKQPVGCGACKNYSEMIKQRDLAFVRDNEIDPIVPTYGLFGSDKLKEYMKWFIYSFLNISTFKNLYQKSCCL